MVLVQHYGKLFTQGCQGNRTLGISIDQNFTGTGAQLAQQHIDQRAFAAAAGTGKHSQLPRP